MKSTLYLIAFLSFVISNGQTKHSEIITLAPDTEKEILIPAYKNDTITIGVDVYKTKRAKKNSFFFYQYPNKLLSKDIDVKSYSNKTIASSNGIYKVVIKNDNSKTTDYTVTYTVASNQNKIPKIGYEVKNDTTYGPETEQLVDNHIQETVTIQNEKFYLNSTSNALLKGGKNRIILPVNLPKNTLEWYYVFSASREETDINNTLSSFNLASQITKFIKEDQSIQNAVSNLSPPPGANICDIYVINDTDNAEFFKEKEAFESSLDGSRENFKSGIVKVSGNTKSYLGIRNPDNLYGIHIAIEIIAVVEKTEKITKLVRTPIITSQKLPYLIE